MSRSNVTRDFAVRSLVPVVLLLLALAVAVRVSVQATVINQWAAANSAEGLGDVLSGADLTRPLDSSITAALDEHFDSRLAGRGVLELRVFGPDGTPVYASGGEDSGEAHEDVRELRRAMAGKTEAHVTGGADDGRMVEVYAPLSTDSEAGPEGVVQLRTSYERVASDVARTTATLWAVLLVGFAGLYASQLGIVRSMARRVEESEVEVVEVSARLHSSMSELEEFSMGTLQALISAVDTKDSYTARHSLGVTDYAVSVGGLMDLRPEQLAELERACLLHDIGKIGVPERVLLKPARLNDHEFELIKGHSEMGARIIESIPFLRGLVSIVRHHHEHWDGSGYPDGLSAEEIPSLSRVIAVADAFDAMTTDRPYRPALRVAAAREELLNCRGAQFDPAVVDAFVAALDSGEITPALYHPSHGAEAEATRAG